MMSSPGHAANTNRQESHRIYLQLFTPQQSTSSNNNTTAAASSPSPQQQQLHRHDSHQIHPPHYPMTTPGAPYRFSSSTSLSNESSFSFSSSSVHPTTTSGGGGGANSTANNSSNNAPHKKRYMQQPGTITTSAAVRLTDRAFARDVTSLLRGKFGLPQPVDHNATTMNSPKRAERGGGLSSFFGQASSSSRRLSPSSINKQQQQQQQRASSSGDNSMASTTRRTSSTASTSSSNYYNYQEPSSPPPLTMDALVLVGTLEGPPKGYVSFEHEEEFGMCEQVRLRCVREREIYWRCLKQQQQQQEQEQLEEQLEEQQQQQQQDQFQTKLEKLDEEKVEELNNNSNTITAYNINSPTRPSTASLSSLPVSSSSITIRASGNTQKGYHRHNTYVQSLSSSSSSTRLDMSSSRDSKMGLDLSSSSQYYGGNNNNNNNGGGRNAGGNSPWRAGVVGGGGVGDNGGHTPSKKDGGGRKMTELFSELSISSASPPPHPPHGDVIAASTNHTGINTDTTATMQFPSVQYEPDLEPIHIIRTVHPDEHPLQVRDEMIKSLERLRKRAEEQMMGLVRQQSSKNSALLSSPGRSGGSGSSSRRQQQQQLQQPQVSVRWYFQPCSPLGGMDSSASTSPKIQSIPAYIELDGYCTDDDDKSGDDVHGEGFDGCDDDETDEDEDGNQAASHIDEMSSTHIRRLNKEKRRIAVLRDLSDSPFVVSGYLLKQSQKDPNVWRRVYCVLAVDRLWVIGRASPLSEFPRDGDVGTTNTNHDVLSSVRVARHSYINLLRSILIEREEPLNHRFPNTFRIVTSLGKTHSFRAFNSQSFKSWTAALSEKIAETHTDGMMDLAHVITEEETLARCRRMEDTAVEPFLSSVTVSTEITPLSMNIVRFGMSVAEYREIRRKVDEATQLYKNNGGVVNVQTRVGGSPNSKANRASLSSLSASQRAKNEAMVTSVWEDARVVASKSAQLLHAIATSQHSILEAVSEDGDAKEEEEKVQGSIGVENHSMKDLIEEQKDIQTILSKRWKHQVTPEAECDMDHLPPLNLFDKLLKQFHSFCEPMG